MGHKHNKRVEVDNNYKTHRNRSPTRDTKLDYIRAPKWCSDCQKDTHNTTFCLKKQLNIRGKATQPKWCTNCNMDNHMTSACTKKIWCSDCESCLHNTKDCPYVSEGCKWDCKLCDGDGHATEQCPDLDPNEMYCYICHNFTHRTADCKVPEKSLKRQASISSTSSSGSIISKIPHDTNVAFNLGYQDVTVYTDDRESRTRTMWVAPDVAMSDAPDIQASIFTQSERGLRPNVHERGEIGCQRMLIADRDRDIFMFDVDNCPHCGFLVQGHN